MWKAYNALGRKPQLRFIHDASLRLGLDPLKMAPAAAFGLADEDPDLAEVEPAEVAPATHGAAVAQSGEREDAAELGAEDLQVSDDEASEDTHAGSDDADDLASEHADEDTAEDADDEVSKTADQEPGGATKCAYCNIDFEDGDQLMEFDGQLYHHFCVEEARQG